MEAAAALPSESELPALLRAAFEACPGVLPLPPGHPAAAQAHAPPNSTHTTTHLARPGPARPGLLGQKGPGRP